MWDFPLQQFSCFASSLKHSSGNIHTYDAAITGHQKALQRGSSVVVLEKASVKCMCLWDMLLAISHYLL